MSSTMRALCGLLLFAGGCGDDDANPRDRSTLDGGSLVDGSLRDASSLACASLSFNQCTPGVCATLSARRIDEVTHCFAEMDGVGCMSQTQGCTAALTLARDPDGGLWQFGGGCFPGGWTSSGILADGQLYASTPPPSWAALCAAADAGR
ncbi:MAG: hypothetical protein JWN04_6797 [Myxococcaceae bacterium]|nr:hypothetical protein [Myxococcaceae bacterium]